MLEQHFVMGLALIDIRQLSAWARGLSPWLKADHMRLQFKTFKQEGIVVFTIDGQKVRMAMGLCLLRIITMVTRATYDAFNDSQVLPAVEQLGHSDKGMTLGWKQAKLIRWYWDKGLPVKLQSQTLSPRILQRLINQRKQDSYLAWREIRNQRFNCSWLILKAIKTVVCKILLSVSLDLYFLPPTESWILTKPSVVIHSMTSPIEGQLRISESSLSFYPSSTGL